MSAKLFVLPAGVLVILLDQITKAKFATSCNTGVAFSLFENMGFVNLVVPAVVALACIYFLLMTKNKVVIFALTLIIGGGISNLADRFTAGCVRDFINLGFWPSFNLADSAVVFGVVILVLAILMKMEPEKSNDPGSED